MHVVVGGFTVVSISVEYMPLIFDLGFYYYVFEIQFPSCIVLLCYDKLVYAWLVF